jgi:uncharacterized coiled-coil DUF342 family protein
LEKKQMLDEQIGDPKDFVITDRQHHQCLRDEVAALIKRTKQLQARKKEVEHEVKQHMQVIDEAKETEDKVNKRDFVNLTEKFCGKVTSLQETQYC